jgi:hypothetical protein
LVAVLDALTNAPEPAFLLSRNQAINFLMHRALSEMASKMMGRVEAYRDYAEPFTRKSLRELKELVGRDVPPRKKIYRPRRRKLKERQGS